MNFLITGCAGFIGFHLCEKLLASKKNYKIFGIDNINSYYDVRLKKERLKILKKKNNFFFKKIDICENLKLKKYFKDNNFDIVVNLAAQAGVRYSIINPHSYINSNIVGFMNILELSKEFKIKHLLYASTSSVYGGNTKLPFSETQPTEKPLNIYAATKKSNELMAHSYSSLFNLRTTGLRFFTVYGPWGRPDMALFLFTKNIIDGKEIKIFNNGNHVRDFTYIDDIVEGIYKLININSKTYFNKKNNIPYRVFNIGSNRPVKLLKYIELIEKNLGVKSKKKFQKIQKGDVISTIANTSYLNKTISFTPETKVEEGIMNFIKWYKEYYKIK